MSDFVSLIENEDLSVFRIQSESTEGDRVSLLMVQNAVRRHFGNYKYLELGSHLGGMLVPHLCDPLCTHIVSIDKRPPSQYDARGRSFDYVDNSTGRMIENIRQSLPEVDIEKLLTIDGDASEISNDSVPFKADLLMIDAEHTNLAATSDFLSLLKFSHSDSVFLFHDANLVFEAVLIVEKIACVLGKSYSTLFLHDNVAVILFGGSIEISIDLQKRVQDRVAYISASREYLKSQIVANSGR